MKYNKSFLHEFRIRKINGYFYVPVDGQLHEILLTRDEHRGDYRALVEAIEAPAKDFQCVITQCDLYQFADCVGCRCIAGSRKDGKPVIFKVHYIFKQQ